jgi:hypothetical protein
MSSILVVVVILIFDVLVIAQTHKNPGSSKPSHSGASITRSPRKAHSTEAPTQKNSSTANELAKIERSGVKPSHKTLPGTQNRRTESKLANADRLAQDKNKRANFSYHPPQSGNRRVANARGNGTTSTKVPH